PAGLATWRGRSDRSRIMACSAYLSAHAEARQRPPRRDAAHVQHGNRHATGDPGKEIQESPVRPRPRRREGIHRGPNCKRRPQGDVLIESSGAISALEDAPSKFRFGGVLTYGLESNCWMLASTSFLSTNPV